jgi:rod shape-determining protein MreD
MIRVFFASIAVLLGVTLIETQVFSNIVALPAVPDLALIALLFLSLHNGPLLGETTGFFSGIILDFISGGPFGLNCFVRTVIGFVCGLFRRTLNTRSFLVHIVLVFFAMILKNLLRALTAFLYPQGNIMVYNFFSRVFAMELGMSIVATPIIYWILSLGKSLFIIPEERDV